MPGVKWSELQEVVQLLNIDLQLPLLLLLLWALHSDPAEANQTLSKSCGSCITVASAR
jgi:hypothetical protein